MNTHPAMVDPGLKVGSGRDRLAAGARWFGILLLFGLSMWIFFRVQIDSRLTLLWGDRLDAGIEAAIVEHWHNVLHGASSWSHTFYFYPEKDTIGYNDTYFLYGIVAAVFRALGANVFLAPQLVDFLNKVIGFWGLFLLLRSAFRVPSIWAAVGAAVFTIGHASFFFAFHEQMISVAYSPWLALFMMRALDALRLRDRKRFLAYGLAAGALFAAWLFSTYYMAWFFALFALTVLVCALPVGGWAYWRGTLRAAWEMRWASLAVALFALVCLVPFLYIYVPKALQTGAHSWNEVFQFTLQPNDIVNSGPDNFLFGGLYNLYCAGCSAERTGITPIQFVLAVVAGIWVLAAYKGPRATLVRGMAIGVFLSWLLVIRIGSYSGWWLVYHIVPGASGARVVPRYQLFLTFPIVVLSVLWLVHVVGRRPGFGIVFVAAVLMLDQIGPNAGIGVAGTELARISVPPPPKDCRVFFTTRADGQGDGPGIDSIYPHNVEAMLIAELNRIPTINGFSTFNPKDWNFTEPTKADYLDRVKTYARNRRLIGLCKLDLAGKQWSGPIDLSADQKG